MHYRVGGGGDDPGNWMEEVGRGHNSWVGGGGDIQEFVLHKRPQKRARGITDHTYLVFMASPPSPPPCAGSGKTSGAGYPHPRDAVDGKGPQRRPQGRLDRRLEEVAKAVGGGYCRLQMPLKLAVGVRETVAGHRLGGLEERGGVPCPLSMHHCPHHLLSPVPRTKCSPPPPPEEFCDGPARVGGGGLVPDRPCCNDQKHSSCPVPLGTPTASGSPAPTGTQPPTAGGQPPTAGGQTPTADPCGRTRVNATPAPPPPEHPRAAQGRRMRRGGTRGPPGGSCGCRASCRRWWRRRGCSRR